MPVELTRRTKERIEELGLIPGEGGAKQAGRAISRRANLNRLALDAARRAQNAGRRDTRKNQSTDSNQ
jgi:hypothetical protein